VTIHGLNYEDAPDNAARWLDTMGDPYTRTGADRDGRVAIDWGVYGVPETFVVGSDGIIAFKQIGPLTQEALAEIILPLIARLREQVRKPASWKRPFACCAYDDCRGRSLAARRPRARGGAAAKFQPLGSAKVATPRSPSRDGAGARRKLSDFRGKFVLLNIWATWCIPCRKEMPTLDRLQGRLGGPDFEVVVLSIDRKGPDVVRKFYADVGIRNLAVNIDAKAEATSALATVGVPTTLLIDRQGQEIGRLIGPAVWDSPEMIDFLKTTIAQKAGQLLSAPTQEKPS